VPTLAKKLVHAVICAVDEPPLREEANRILPPLLKKYLASSAVENVQVNVAVNDVDHEPEYVVLAAEFTTD
jgi:hypothetical protein